MRIAAIGIVFAIGCSGTAEPSFYQVRGTVLKAGKPVPGCTVQFLNQNDSLIRAVAETDKDGVFTLETLVSGGKKSGAVTGPYKAVIMFTANEAPIHPDTVYVVEAKENMFTIELN